MTAFTLRNAVPVTGHSLFGFQTELTLFPVDAPGWNFCDESGAPHPISCSMLRKGASRNLDLSLPPGLRKKLCIIEHLFALRLGMGLCDGVGLTVPTHGIPFSGNAENFRARVAGALVEAASCKRFTIGERSRTIRSGGGYAYFEPLDSDELIVDVSIDYGGSLKGRYVWSSKNDDFAAIAAARGELKPHLRPLVRLAAKYGWPHEQAFADKERMTNAEWIDNLLRHRVIDALGALSLAHGEGKLCGVYRGHRASHAMDVLVTQDIAGDLVQL